MPILCNCVCLRGWALPGPGSLLVGPQELIDRARRYRKMLGGGLRQAGILAAAGIVALETMVDRLAEDHQHARMLGEAMAEMGLAIDLETVQTNIVIFDVSSIDVTANTFVAKLRERGIKVNAFGEYKIRMVTHYGVTREDIRYTVDILAKLVKGE
ncbi:Threonine aldolase [Thermosinus carboxydivorans Nor1]|uniref:Threonine aldolase n=2 Tax=Thermosinus TaxID=261684 RepID=A1HU89_9FIRM|nr:Threonine aldolase [Thermosinus carboxydivorans Nor1]